MALSQREAARRQQLIRNAQELLTDAELDRRDGHHAEAVEKFRTAFRSLPDSPATAALRESIFKRYQQGAVDWAGQLIAEARWQEAENALAQVMSDAQDGGIAAGQIDPKLRQLLARLRSDDYFNKAMSPEHLANVGSVERYLSDAEGYFQIGDLDRSVRSYQAALNVDRTNSAARRGLEKVERMITEYAEVTRNQTRATMLRQVAEGWESPVPPLARPDGYLTAAAEPIGAQQATLQEKLNRITIPQVEFVNTPLATAIEFLVQTSRERDTAEPDPSKRGVNIVIDPQSATDPAQWTQRPVTLSLSGAPLGIVLQYTAQQAGMRYRVDPFAVTVVPASATDDLRLMTRTYQVPPDFISGTAGAPAAGGPVDPFAAQAPGAGGTTLVRRMSAREFLENNGVTFPAGALANFNPVSSTLMVKNTPDNISLIDALVMAAKEGGSKMVMVEFKLMETTQRTLNELGYDWLLSQFNVPGSDQVFASGGVPGNTAGSRTFTDFPIRNPNGIPVGGYPLTSGLRSGSVRTGLSIDDVIARDSPTPVGSSAAPGILGVSGVFTDPQFQVVLRGLSQSQGVDILCAASVLTRPGERAVIKQVREFIYPTEYDPPEVPNQVGGDSLTLIQPGFPPITFSSGAVAATPATPAAFTTRELGKILDVEPTVGPDNLTVDLNLITDFSEFVGFINYGSAIRGSDTSLDGFAFDPPQFFTTSYDFEITENRILMPVFEAIKETTSVTIFDGQTLVVGGFLGETVNKSQDKVPLLGDTPLVGKFFRSEVEERFRRVILLFATVRIVDGGGQPLNDLSQFTR